MKVGEEATQSEKSATWSNSVSKSGASAAYRGYRLQALYTLGRMMAPGARDTLVFQPESVEDLAVWMAEGRLMEAIQVKSYDNLVLSDLSPAEPTSFLRRAAKLAQTPDPPEIKLVNFGGFGPEMHQAWAGEVVQRSRVAHKLRQYDYDDSEIEAIFDRVELVELDEARERAVVMSLLQELLTGVDPESAFDLLNFWLYRNAEKQTRIKCSDLTQRIMDVGRFLAERHTHHSEWFTSITPITDQQIPESQRSFLQEEFFAGAAARYEHILADLDFRRDSKLAEIKGAFERRQVVIVHAASGQGKTTLAYRYLHDGYPDKYRFSIELIQDRQHALKIAGALAGHANAVQAPMVVYIDVSPRDTDWPELIKRLARYPYLHILVTIREEDFRRANVSGVDFDFASIELTFDEAEARLIYERATATQPQSHLLNFEDAWDRFGGKGPLMEFVYLLTQTVSLRQRLQQQVNRIRDEVRSGRAHPDELELLRLVSVTSAYEVRLRVPDLVGKLHLPEPSRTLELFEKEYLIRLSQDRLYIEGLHPIRSRILAEFLIDADVTLWLNLASQALLLMAEDDLESFLLHAFVDRPSERYNLIEVIRQFVPATWTGRDGILRALLWSGMYDYVEANMPVLEAARQEFGPGWWFIADLDFTGVAKEVDRWWIGLGSLIPAERQARFEAIRARQTPKEEALSLASDWLTRLPGRPLPPVSLSDWVAVAEICFWGQQFGIPSVEQWLSDDDLAGAVTKLALNILADLSLALYLCNKERHTAWMQESLAALEVRLAQEFTIVSLEKQDDAIRLHFLPSQITSGKVSDQGETAARKQSSDPLHDETMERVQLIRRLFPNYETYGSQGYGYRLGSLVSPLDTSTTKEGILASRLPPS